MPQFGLPVAPFSESYVLPSSQTTSFAGLPFYPSTPAARAPTQAMPVHNAQGSLVAVDPVVFSQPIVSGGWSSTGPELAGSHNNTYAHRIQI